MARSTPEGRVKDKIDRALRRLTHLWWFMPVFNGYGRRTLDYICCVNGRFVGIEAKAPNKDLTDFQKSTKQEIEDSHGIVFRIRDEDELTEFVEFAQALGCELKH